MSTVVCESQSTTNERHISDARYLWPSFSFRTGDGRGSSSENKQSALRVVTSEFITPAAQKPSTTSADTIAPGPGVRASFDSPASPRADATAPVREQARHPHTFSSSPSTTSKVKTHVRAKSTTAAGEPSRLDFPHARTTVREPQPSVDHYPRARAASSATMGPQPRSRPRPRLPSMLSSVRSNPRAAVQTQIAPTGESELVGSFTPTSCPRRRLLSILSTGAAADLSPTPSATQSPRRISLRLDTGRPECTPADAATRRRLSVSSPMESPSTPLPSICRTPSSYSGSEYFPTAPSSAGPATPVHTAATLPVARKSESLHPVLENLERTSLFCVQTACATCGKGGSNFPCCPRCGEMWCSRACRLQRGNGKRHICSRSA
ncbi:hypothetical protein C8Q78DRAFT_1032040 [Trametes maxima]|nr:hypothetical protein C8Q78DRAFT_1032040 [Trametes maxima]